MRSEDAASLAVLPPDLLRDLLSSDGLSVGSELDVAQAALLWAAADPRARAPLLPQLLPAARMPPGRLAEEAAAAGLLGGEAEWRLQQALAGRCSPCKQQHCEEQDAEEQAPQPPATPQQGGLSELGHAFVHACHLLQRSGSAGGGDMAAAAAAGVCASGPEAAAVVYRPRLSSPTGLMLAGGLDDGWRPLR